jgi:nicotinate dehydrogenase subunit B
MSLLYERADAAGHKDTTGTGELSITIAAAAVGNAIFDATGVRLRELPFTPERVKAALRIT